MKVLIVKQEEVHQHTVIPERKVRLKILACSGISHNAFFWCSLTQATYWVFGIYMYGIYKLHCGNAVSSTHWPCHSITDSVLGFSLTCMLIMQFGENITLSLICHIMQVVAMKALLQRRKFSITQQQQVTSKKSFIINQGDSALLSEAVFEKAVNCTA